MGKVLLFFNSTSGTSFIKGNTILAKHQTLSSGKISISAGVVLFNTSGGSVLQNTILLQNNMFSNRPRFYGVYKESGSGNLVCGNTITCAPTSNKSIVFLKTFK